MNGEVWGRARDRAALRVGKNAVARLAAQVVARLLSLLLVALVARYEGTAGLGRYVLVVTVVGIAGAVSDLGLNTFVTREMARQPGEARQAGVARQPGEAHQAGEARGPGVARQADGAHQREFLGRVLPLKAIVALAGFGILVGVAALAPFPEPTKRAIPLGALSLLPDALSGAMGALVNGRQRMEVSGALAMAVRLVAVAGSLPVLAAGFGVGGVLGCTVGASLVGAVLYGAVLRRWGLLPRWRWDPMAWRGYLRESYPFALTSAIAMAYARLDLLLLGLWQGDLAAGWYGAAYKLWEALGLLPASVMDAMFPEMSRLSASGEGVERLRALFRIGGRAMLAGGFLLAIGGALWARLLVPIVYGTGEYHAPTVLAFRLLVWAIPAMFLVLLSGHALYAVGRQRRVTVAMLAVGAANLAANLVAIPRWSYMGAAGVALASEWLLMGMLYGQARRSLSLKPET